MQIRTKKQESSFPVFGRTGIGKTGLVYGLEQEGSRTLLICTFPKIKRTEGEVQRMPIAGRPFRQERDTSLQVMIMGLSGRVVMWEVSARTPEPAGFHKEVPAAKAEAAAERTFPCLWGIS